MKTRNIFLLLLIIFLNGCSSRRHMGFKDIPIDGNLDKFVNELIKSGFSRPQSIEDDHIKLKGVFLEKNCEIHVYATAQNQTSYKVRVDLPEEVQDSIEYRYDKIRQLFKLKYGTGTSKYQQFQNAERFLFNEPKRIRHLSQGDFTRYATGQGLIYLTVRAGYISITYLDKHNSDIYKKEAGAGKQESVTRENMNDPAFLFDL